MTEKTEKRPIRFERFETTENSNRKRHNIFDGKIDVVVACRFYTKKANGLILLLRFCVPLLRGVRVATAVVVTAVAAGRRQSACVCTSVWYRSESETERDRIETSCAPCPPRVRSDDFDVRYDDITSSVKNYRNELRGPTKYFCTFPFISVCSDLFNLHNTSETTNVIRQSESLKMYTMKCCVRWPQRPRIVILIKKILKNMRRNRTHLPSAWIRTRYHTSNSLVFSDIFDLLLLFLCLRTISTSITTT